MRERTGGHQWRSCAAFKGSLLCRITAVPHRFDFSSLTDRTTSWCFIIGQLQYQLQLIGRQARE